MSDSYLLLIPTDPHFVPSPAAAELARLRLEQLVPDAEDVTAVVNDSVEFIDQGSNFERVRCPHCGRVLAQEWWSDRFDQAEATEFSALEVSVPCCGSSVSLNDLKYELPAGFAKFVLETMNPNVRDFPDEALADLSRDLGTPLRRIWAHY